MKKAFTIVGIAALPLVACGGERLESNAQLVDGPEAQVSYTSSCITWVKFCNGWTLGKLGWYCTEWCEAPYDSCTGQYLYDPGDESAIKCW